MAKSLWPPPPPATVSTSFLRGSVLYSSDVNALFRWTALGFLLALRLPSLVQPAGADQSLYAYIGLRMLAGEAPYIDAWDQKPPGIHALYALLWWIWPDERVVAAADLAAAIGVSWLLVVLGRRIATPAIGWLAACIFALLANPSLQRLSGVFVRSQCETFIALAITAALALLCADRRRQPAAIAAGVLLGLAIWLKYNAVVFALPLFTAAWLWRPAGTALRDIVPTLVRITAGAVVVGAVGLAWLAWHGALTELWLATFAYNVHYSSEGYASPGAAAMYVLTMPFRQGRHDLLWFIGLTGLGLALSVDRVRPAAILAATWIGAAIIAIALNGRDLPQYFVQATPALAAAGAAGFAAAWQTRRTTLRVLVAALLVVGLWRVGTDTPLFGVARLASLPGLVDNMRLDIAYWRGRIDRRTYLDRFGGQRARDKYAARDVEEIADLGAAAHGAGGQHPGVRLLARRVPQSRSAQRVPFFLEPAGGN